MIHAITSATGLDGEAVHNVRVLDRFALLEVPSSAAANVIELLDGKLLDGHRLRLLTADG